MTATMAVRTMTAMMIGMFAFLLSVVMYFVAPSAPAPLSLPVGSQSLDFCPSAPSNTLDSDDVACGGEWVGVSPPSDDRGEWDMLSVALAMYKLYWVELRQKEADERPSKRRRTEVMPPLRRENTVAQIANALGGLGSALWDFLALIISLLPNLGVRLTHILAVIAIVFISLYIFIVRGWGDSLVRSTQMAVLGLIFPNSSAVVKEF